MIDRGDYAFTPVVCPSGFRGGVKFGRVHGVLHREYLSPLNGRRISGVSFDDSTRLIGR